MSDMRESSKKTQYALRLHYLWLKLKQQTRDVSTVRAYLQMLLREATDLALRATLKEALRSLDMYRNQKLLQSERMYAYRAAAAYVAAAYRLVNSTDFREREL
ncbi:MAG: hypothetical protein KatS3mg038_1029 [Candidatus Kapaibacterium sp.]|nr:MAG: hypothetical protein KatS3mg038_1029 [Candidatus Kapabacteria bacterium]